MSYSPEEFLQVARRLPGQRSDKRHWLAGFYEAARTSTGLPAAEDSEAIRMFRRVLSEYLRLRRFRHSRQFFKYCSRNLSTKQSGQFRGTTGLYKRGKARLRYAFWVAGAVAVRARQNSFCQKFQDYIRRDPLNPDLRRKDHTTVAANMAWVVYAVVKTETYYRRFPEATVPRGRTPSPRAVEAISTS
ncbi:MAG: transposase [Acidobacteriia bacterium]|nr:transposase [Terriglobia bacterium]